MKSQLLNNWKLKILAVALATLSYYVIRGKTSIEVRYDVPLEIRVDEGIAVLDQDPRTVQVTFRGSQEDLRKLDQTLLKAGIVIVEGLTNLRELRRDEIEFIVLPLKIRGCDGSPVRAIAIEE